MEEYKINSKAMLKEWLKKEYMLYGGHYLPIMIREKDILHRHLTLLRKAEYYTNKHNKIFSLIYKLRLQRIQNLYALHIPLNTCAVGLNIAHVGPVVVNSNARIGENARIHVGVNVGANAGGHEAPRIGNNVYIGPGAKVFGDIEIASEVIIGANAVVNKTCLRKGAVLVGVPAIEKERKGGK